MQELRDTDNANRKGRFLDVDDAMCSGRGGFLDVDDAKCSGRGDS